jgi:hypothetical protein
MVATGGIATGSSAPAGFQYRPEAEAVFLCGSLDEADWFATFGGRPLVDIWQVDARGLVLEDGPDGWLICREPIAASRVGLARPDVPPPVHEAIDSPHADQLTFRVARRHDSRDGSPG